jgi:hypothetical protein
LIIFNSIVYKELNLNSKEFLVQINKIMEVGMQAFKQKFMAICKKDDFQTLTPALAEEMSGTIREALCAAGLASFKSFIESYETDDPIIERDGKKYRYKYSSGRPFLTVFGEVVIDRRIYQRDAGGYSLVPLDEHWGMANEFATMEVRESVLFSVVHNTPEETETLLRKCALFHPSATTIKRITDKTGVFFEEHQETIRKFVIEAETIPEKSHTMVCSLDGTNVLLKEKGAKQGRPLERPMAEAGSQDSTAYRNAMVGSISFYAQRQPDEKHPERLVSRYVARMPEAKALSFKLEFEFELEHVLRDTSSDRLVKILLMDGQRSLWKYAEGSPLYEDFEWLIDFYHTTEHLSKAAEALFGKSSSGANAWYAKYRKLLLEEEGAPLAILRSMYYYRDTLKLPKSRKADLKAELTFFGRNKSKMLYADFIKRGLPIGSGPIEAACKSIVKTRLGRSGMRWSRKGGQNILVLRAYAKSDRWDNSWKSFKQLSLAA